MQLVKHKVEKLYTERKFPGLIDVRFDHEIKSTTATFKWLGPFIQPEVWQEVLAFFKWTYDTTHSESQVRLFVNPQKGVWDAWAFPQEARTGMTARELDNEDSKKQREQYPDNEGWVYFGTVHHHCSCSAFQSGTDEANERNQDGLHITVGSMDKPLHDLHCRFYLGSSQFEPDMSLFWDIGEEVRRLIPIKFWNEVARYQMGKQGPDGKFCEMWKTNMVEIKSTTSFSASVGGHYLGSSGGGSYYGGYKAAFADAKRAVCQTIKEALRDGIPLERLITTVEELANNDAAALIGTNLDFYKVSLEDFIKVWPDDSNAVMLLENNPSLIEGVVQENFAFSEVEPVDGKHLSKKEKKKLKRLQALTGGVIKEAKQITAGNVSPPTDPVSIPIKNNGSGTDTTGSGYDYTGD